MIPSGRTFHPLYKSTGDESMDRLAFFHILERLKTQKRTGWVDHKIPNPESISDHMYRMTVLALCCTDETLDIPKCVMLAVVHDLAEAQVVYQLVCKQVPGTEKNNEVGDIAPRENIPKEEKRRLEAEAMHNFVHEMLHDSPAARRIGALWQEYEDQLTPEARFVKDLDRFELASQALEYERSSGDVSLQSFFDNSLPFVRHPEVQSWGRDLERERAEERKAVGQ